ncbi:PaaX family transcriptional regulator C-terminal domain-containing protein [Roseomonas sp. CCTCC AB2023176]|uniref:PaaX family transcriptional regulator C-terminal domain-containing protein n=1 Tax=Roseomonas sp. CCTCC AB2023176 TaxID=3342640 RepID=UPI0035E2B1D1
MPDSPSLLARQIARLHRLPRTAPLIVTVWGDAVVPRGGSLWLGTLERIMAPFGVNPGGLRTAMSRLVEDGWLERSRQGRLSFYRLGPRGEEFAAADRHIYAPEERPWDGRFRLVLGPADGARAALLGAGWGTVGPDLLVGLSAASEGSEAESGLRIELDSAAVQLRAVGRAADARALANRAWALEAVAARYARFAAAFAPLDGAEPPPEEALPLRILLIHEFRRVALRDPNLPAALLPEPWPGAEARALAARLYRALLPASEAWLAAEGRAEAGSLPPPGRALAGRFAAA